MTTYSDAIAALNAALYTGGGVGRLTPEIVRDLVKNITDTIALAIGDVDANAHKLRNLADPALAQDAATKAYVDALFLGLDPKPSVRAATTANITLSGTQAIDGVSLIAGDRALVKNQSTAANNGIYVVASGAWTRALDMDAWAEVPGALVIVEEGSTLADTMWICTANQGGTLGTTTISFQVLSGVTGPSGTDAGITWNFATSTSMADPSAGNIRFNNATLASVTALAVSYSSGLSGSPSVANWVKGWGASTTAGDKGRLIVKKDGAPQNYIIFKITAAVTDNTTWGQVTVTVDDSAGSLSAADPLIIDWERTGNAGAGSGDLLAANNLSDLASKATGFDNLSIAEANVASASTTNIGAATTSKVNITGTTTITAFDSVAAGRTRWCRFAGALVLTHNGTSLILPNNGSNITTAAGDTMLAMSLGSGNWVVLRYTKANGKALAAIASADITAAVLAALAFGPFTNLASATTTDLSSIGTTGINITGTTTITGFGTGANLLRILKFAGALVLTHNATSLILPNNGSNITTAAGDTAIALADASGNWTVVSYSKANGQALQSASGSAISPAVDIRLASATITIPTGATKCKVTLVAGGGGGGGTAGGACCTRGIGGPGGGAAALIKYLSGLTPGNTLALTIGAAGAAGAAGNNAGGDGGDTTLASGTQSITTLTAGKGLGGAGSNGNSVAAAGAAGAASNGDINLAGVAGATNSTSLIQTNGVSGFGFSAAQLSVLPTSAAGAAGNGLGGGGFGGTTSTATTRAGGVGTQGAAIFEWFA